MFNPKTKPRYSLVYAELFQVAAITKSEKLATATILKYYIGNFPYIFTIHDLPCLKISPYPNTDICICIYDLGHIHICDSTRFYKLISI